MTATPRVYTPHLMKAAEDSGIDVASMDDEVWLILITLSLSLCDYFAPNTHQSTHFD